MKTRSMFRRLRIGGSTLFLVSSLLIASAAIRLFLGAETALAVEFSDTEKTPDAEMNHMPGECSVPDDLKIALEIVQSRQKEIENREANLADRVSALRLAEQEIQENLLALKMAEDSLSATMTRAKTASEDDLARLTAVYENMKPKEASALFEEMDPEFAAGFLGRMRPDAAAAIMTGLNSGKAYAISVILAGRNANAPSE